VSKPVTGLTTFAGLAPPWQLQQLDSDIAALQNAINDLGTYSNPLQDTSGVANTITVTTAGSLTAAYNFGLLLHIKIANTTTSATVNINLNGLGNQLVKLPGGLNPVIGQFLIGAVYAFVYDGTNFELVNGIPLAVSATGDFTGRGIAQCKYKAATTSRNTTVVLTDDPDLQTGTLGVGTYQFNLMMFMTGTTTTNQGIKWIPAFTGTVTTAIYTGSVSVNGVADPFATSWGQFTVTNGANVLLDSGALGNTDYAYMFGTIVVSAPGVFKLQWAQFNSSANNTNLKIGSYLTVTQMS